MRLFKIPSFILLFFGRIVTNVADSIYYVASMWLVYDLTKDPFYTGVAGFLTSIPWALQFLIGPLVDRWRTKRILVWTQLLQCGLISIIPIFYAVNLLSVSLVLILLPIASIIQQFTYPAQSKALPLVVKKEQLLKANSYFSVAYQGVDFIFNALAGIFISLVGVYYLLAIDAVLFALAACLFMLLKLQQTVSSKAKNFSQKINYHVQLKEGLQVVAHSTLLLFTFGAMAINFAIGGLMAILPALAAEKGGASYYGYYLAVISVGGLLGALIAPYLQHIRMGKLYVWIFLIGSLSFVVSGMLENGIASLALFSLIWISIGISNVIVPSAIQNAVPIELLGRVQTVSVSASTISMPLGSLVFGLLGNIWSLEIVYILIAIPFIFEILLWGSVKQLRQLPEVRKLDANVLKLTDQKE